MLDQFTRQNRWWADPAQIQSDRHLTRVNEARLAWSPDLPFRFDRDSVYTVRGPRQVGKTTLLKRQIQALLVAGWPARKILYVDVELAGLERARDLVSALREYLDSERPLRPDTDERCAIFLDEVTRADGWAGALRGLIDNGELDRTTVIATGSHTRDLREGGDRLPGRRGGGSELDLELLPLSFREYVQLVEPGLRLPTTIGTPTAAELRAGSRQRDSIRHRLNSLFERYLLIGGFLTALNDDATYSQVRAETYQSYRDSIIGEFTRAGLRESYLRELINWLVDHLGQEFDYRDVAADTDIGSKDTARNYLDHLESSYVLGIFHRTASLAAPAPAFRGPKKVHPKDPFWWHLLLGWAASDPDPWQSAVALLANSRESGRLVESVVASELQRGFGERVFYWRPDAQREIDFVVVPPGSRPAPIEVKYQRRIDAADARGLIAAGGGLLLTQNWHGDLGDGAVYALPVAEFLATLDTRALSAARW